MLISLAIARGRPLSNYKASLISFSTSTHRASPILSSACCLYPHRAPTTSESYARRWPPCARRSFVTDYLPSFLVPPLMFTGLLLSLWTYKCIMTVIFQDRIIYMPYMPPFTRSERMLDHVVACKPVEWQEQYIRSHDGTRLAICIGSIPPSDRDGKRCRKKYGIRETVIIYLHGNGGSLPPRLPMLSNVLKAIVARAVDSPSQRYSLIALSYRGYWSSSGRASQTGIEMDVQALLQWVNTAYVNPRTDVEIVIWGQSIGAGVASTATAEYLTGKDDAHFLLSGLIMETPFTSIKAMLIALYPQRWLPYQYLWPFLWNHWDSQAALRRIASNRLRPKILLLPATRDEVVPPEEAGKLEMLCEELHLDVRRIDVMGALHTEATTRREGQKAVAEFVVQLSSVNK